MSTWQEKKEARSRAYSEKLRDPRWQKLRLLILERDNWTCQSCHCTEYTLNVHHKFYTPDTAPWDYPPEVLVTLCEDCHAAEKEIAKEYEPLLIETLYRKGFLADDLRELALAFSNMCCFEDSYKFPHALAVASRNTSFWYLVLELAYDTILKDMAAEKANSVTDEEGTPPKAD